MEIKRREFLDVSTRTCHASTMAFFKDKPIYAWFGGFREGMPDCAIYIQCGDKLHITGIKDKLPRWNPILFEYNDQLFIFVKIGLFCDRWNTLIYNISGIFDEDFDINKVQPQILPAGLNGPVKTKPILVENHIYCGSSVETIVDWTSYVEVYEVKNGLWVYRDRSRPLTALKQIYYDDYTSRKIMTSGIIQPSLWQDKDGVIHAFFRSSKGLGKIYYSKKDSEWTDPVATNLDNPNSGIDTVYSDGRLFLVHNPSSDYRYPIVVSELDEQFNEKERLVIRESVEEKDVTYSVELSYPYMVKHEDTLHLTYTYGRSRIEHVEIEI